MSEEYVILFDEKKCTGCHGCETACKSWRNVEPGVTWRKVYGHWRGTYPSVTTFSSSVACMHCVDPCCIEACPAGAIEKRTQDGIVVVNRDECTGCQACLDACPFHIPQFGIDETMQKCDLCLDESNRAAGEPPCVATCPVKALWFGKISKAEKKRAEQSLKALLESK